MFDKGHLDLLNTPVSEVHHHVQLGLFSNGLGLRTKPRPWLPGKNVVVFDVGVAVSSDSEMHKGLDEPQRLVPEE